MTLKGYQFDKAKVTPEADAQLYSYLAQSYDNKVISGLTATATGLNVYLAAGKALVQGRLVENGQQAQLTAQANKIGYVCIVIDLTQTNTSTGTPGTSDYVPVNNQLRLELVETLNKQNLNAGGFVYTFPLYAYEATAATVTLTKVSDSFRDVFHDTKEIAWTGNLTAGTAIYDDFSRFRSLICYGISQNKTQFVIEVDLTKSLISSELGGRDFVSNIAIGSHAEGAANREWKLAVGTVLAKNNTTLDARYRDGTGNWVASSSTATFIYKIVGVY
ncbi:MAG: hypothetical protein ACLUQC_08425 [Lactococcus raffinolactis]|uniref:hypothetical protein n=1 Tax=Pseudolactococcus raffinolactis TaxID=1366 RepID=UPI003992F951